MMTYVPIKTNMLILSFLALRTVQFEFSGISEIIPIQAQNKFEKNLGKTLFELLHRGFKTDQAGHEKHLINFIWP